MPQQLFVGPQAPQAALLDPIINIVGFPKPHGGIWTSPLADGSSEWVEFLDTATGLTRHTTSFVLDVASGARVAEIDSRQDLDVLTERYMLHSPFGHETLDFEALSGDFDGLHLTATGMNDCRFELNGRDLWPWDIESTIWFRWSFT